MASGRSKRRVSIVSFLKKCEKHIVKISLLLVGKYQKRKECARYNNCFFLDHRMFHSKCVCLQKCYIVVHTSSFLPHFLIGASVPLGG